VSVIETSDLVRADRYSALATSTANERLRRDAIRNTDRLFGRLLAHVDLSQDAVLVLAPVPRTGDRSVTIAGLRAPGVDPGPRVDTGGVDQGQISVGLALVL
jgi:hypothetical protein